MTPRTLTLALTAALMLPHQPVFAQTENEATAPVPRDDEWWTERHAEKLAERDDALSEGRRVRLVFVGDSITHGWENAGKSLWEERFAPRGAMNIGFSGDRTEHVLWRLGMGEGGEKDNEVSRLSPDLFVVMIGTNNTGHRQAPPEETAEGVELIVDRLLETSPYGKVLLLAVFPRDAKADGELRQINDGVNALISGLDSRSRVEYLDINDVFLGADGELPEKVMPDLLHPNEAGYLLWADAIEPHIARLLGEK